ncbi:MAG: GAF domain-containing protein [Ornithinimicrobium sp.]|uniref:helix-turn-helix domain-containing protein n=1 Tax=Ornithinimicrobium sp. TaxID=1977084 RepID=UPI0026E0D3E7|nr:GAF domain-containing protein [Ornithinimicrobium sp.]MDO5738762.1 GAF domain-containing protein [Ornithinimicrobium sp.]
MSQDLRLPGERFLALLAEDRPLQDYNALLSSLQEEGGDPDDVQRLHDLAVRARALREIGQRRESELSALFDTVADLAELKELDDVLEAIVRRARTLLACDVSYLSLNDDEAGETYMRITQGIHTEEFRNVRLPFGAGLGGLVAQTARPYATDDYFTDERFRHLRGIDHAVAGEEIRSIMGVPLLIGRRVIGVLYAANHEVRPFAREDIDLMTSFAAHAAIALDNARRVEQTAAALADLKATGELLQRNIEGVQRSARAHDRLAGVVLRGGGLEDMASELHQVLEEPVQILDAQGAVLASSAPDLGTDDVDLDQLHGALEENHTVTGDGRSVAPVWAGGVPLAAVLLRSEVDEVNQRILERAAMTAALIMVVRRSVAQTESRLRGDLLVDLLVGRAGAGSLTARASLLGTDLSRKISLLVIDGADPRVRQATGDLAATHSGLSAEVGDRMVLMLPDRDALETGRHIVQLAGRTRPSARRTVGRVLPTVGVAGPVTGVEGVRSAYQEATRCLEALLALGRRGDVADSASLGFVGLLLGKGDPADQVDAVLGPVLDYDRDRGTDLVLTLETWLGQDRHLGRSGEELHLHPNTVTQRLDRVGRLLGDGWQSPERLLEVSLALRLRRVLPSP